MSLNSLSKAMPAFQSSLPSRFDNRASSGVSAASASAARSVSGSSSTSLRNARPQQLATSSISASAGPASSDLASVRPAARPGVRPREIIYANPPTMFVWGVPVTIVATTCISMGLNLISIILMATADCSFGLYQVRHMFGFLVLAELVLGAMLLFNIFYHHYRYNCLSLSLSFVFSGSAALLIFELIETLFSGLCRVKGTPGGSIMISKYPVNYAVWFLTALSVSSQLVAHYYYG